ncbi:hypothetical protein HN865_02810 [Candidatus Woesearchaeota archaeon]|jgi:hypothetical protein|nr:hypothetical protein [Candidatus Woesearchaeota archaeon]MBT7237767.1 hypothetical protein [Candidatus Woesearchaeota archaeon]
MKIGQERIEGISDVVEGLISERRGQLPRALYHQARGALPDYDINWKDMDPVFNYLQEQKRIFPVENFSKNIATRAYKVRS